MQRMILQVLDHARAGRERGEPERVDLADVVREVVAMPLPPATVTAAVASELPTLFTERALLQQVLLTLVANGIAHGGPGVPAAVAARDMGPQIEVSVADEGPGVPAALRERVWNLFHTGTASAPGESTGIGLAVVKRLAEDRGGRAWVADPGAPGADFRFTWPEQPTTGR